MPTDLPGAPRRKRDGMIQNTVARNARAVTPARQPNSHEGVPLKSRIMALATALSTLSTNRPRC
jgi:ribosomal protein L4